MLPEHSLYTVSMCMFVMSGSSIKAFKNSNLRIAGVRFQNIKYGDAIS